MKLPIKTFIICYIMPSNYMLTHDELKERVYQVCNDVYSQYYSLLYSKNQDHYINSLFQPFFIIPCALFIPYSFINVC